jgi:hypothetical protein
VSQVLKEKGNSKENKNTAENNLSHNNPSGSLGYLQSSGSDGISSGTLF